MNNELLKEFQLQAGGSHYPTVNPQMQAAFAKMIIERCAELGDRSSPGPFNTYGDLIRDHFKL